MADATPQHLDLTPERIDLEIQQGTDVEIQFQLTNDEGTAADITDDTVKFTGKDGFGGNLTIATKTNLSGQHSFPTEGKTIFVLTKEDTTMEDPTSKVTWWYEIRRIFDGTNREVIYIHGQLQLMPSVGTDA